MKYILLLILFVACKPHVCPPTTKIIEKHDTAFYPVIDTLVIIQNFDSVRKADYAVEGKPYFMPGGSEIRPSILFKDGRRIDTIFQIIPVYY